MASRPDGVTLARSRGNLRLGRRRWLLSLFSLAAPRYLASAQKAESGQVKFVDVAGQAGLTAMNFNGGDKSKSYIIESTGSGIAFFDYNNDSFADVFMVNGSRLGSFPPGMQPSNHLYRNNGNGTFTDVTEAAGLVHSGWGQGVCVGDYDNDGWLDLFVTYYGGNILYHNNQGKNFTDVTEAAGLSTGGKSNYSTGCAFVDYDRDGWVDLFVSNYVDFEMQHVPPRGSANCRWKGVPVFCGPKGLPLSRNHLYHNNRNGTFTDASNAAGINSGNQGYAFSVLTGDFRNCGWPDIYVASDSTPSLYYRNNKDGTFQEVGLEIGVAYSDAGIGQAGMGLTAGDYTCNGFLDIFKTNFIDDEPNLYKNDRDGTFTDVFYQAIGERHTEFMRWGDGFIDYDNDGWKDIFQANGHVYPEVEAAYPHETYRQRKILYHNRGDGTFEDVSRTTGPGLLLKRSSRGVAFADFDNDGDIDAVINNQNDPLTLLRNDGGNRLHWIGIQTIGTKSNRAGIGTRIRVVTGTHCQIDEVRSGGSYISQSDLRVHFGLGNFSRIDILELRWPSGVVDRIRGLAADHFVTVKEGVGIVNRFQASG